MRIPEPRIGGGLRAVNGAVYRAAGSWSGGGGAAPAATISCLSRCVGGDAAYRCARCGNDMACWASCSGGDTACIARCFDE